MSKEIRAAHQCPHLVIEEPVSLSADRQSLITKAPIAAADSVFILINDTDYIPSEGLYSSATLTSSSPGPYRIQKCVGLSGPDGNLLTIQSSAGTVSLRLDLGDRITVSQIERQLRLQASNVIASDSNGVLSVMDAGDPGMDSYVQVSGGGADALGFVQKGVRGKLLYPGWVLAKRADVNPVVGPANLLPNPARYPKFTSPLKGSPTIKVTYTAVPNRCPRCSGTWVENDYRFDLNGDIVTIENENLLYQACMKAILTVLGSNPYHPAYGSKIMTRIGSKAVGASRMLIKEDVSNALKKVQDLQRSQAKYQLVTEKERLYAVRDVLVTQDENDPTVFRVRVIVSNGSNKPIVIDIAYVAPGAVALAGTNGMSLGLQPTGLH